MSEDAGQIQVTIALVGADEFDSGVQQITGDLGQLQSAAEEASGSSGIGGLGTASASAGGSTSGLSGSTRDLSTSIGALGGSLSATIGGIMNMQSSQIDLQSSTDSVASSQTAVEKATNAYQSALAKYGDTGKDATKTTKELSTAQEGLSKSTDTIHKDYENITKDEQEINKLRVEGKTNTTQYSNAIQKLQDDMHKLSEDQGKAKDAQDKVNMAHEDFANKAAPTFDLGANKIKAAYDHLIDAENRHKIAVEEHAQLVTRSYLSMAQTVLGAIGSISSGIGVLTKVFQGTKTTTDEFGNSATTIGTRWGSLIGTGGVLALAGVALYAIATNAGGVRTSMEKWFSSISQGNPILDGFGHLIHGIAADLGLTGTGIMSGNDEITKAINSIHQALQQTNIGKDLGDLSTKFQQFLKDPFGNNASYGPVSGPQQIFGITNKPDTFFAPGIGKNITSVGPNAEVIGQAPSNAQQLADAILKVISDGVDLVNKALSPGGQYGQIVHGIWDKLISDLNDASKNPPPQTPGGSGGGKNPMQQVGFNMLSALADYLSGKEAKDKASKPFWDLINNIADMGPLGPAGPNKDQLSQIGTAILQNIFSFGQGAGAAIGQLTGGKDILAGVVDSIGNALFGSKEWGNMGTKFSNALASIFGGGADQHGNIQGGQLSAMVEKIFGPLFDVQNWTSLGPKAIAAIESVFGGGSAQAGKAALSGLGADVGKIFGPLFDTNNWTSLGSKAIAALVYVFSGGAQGSVSGLGASVDKIFGPLFNAANWTKLFQDAKNVMLKATTVTQVYDAIKPLFDLGNWNNLIKDAGAAILKATTVTRIYDAIKPLFDLNNWANLIKDAEKAMVKALTVASGDVPQILAALADSKNWGYVGKAITDALYGFLKAAVDSIMSLGGLLHQSAFTVPGTTSGGGFLPPKSFGGGPGTTQLSPFVVPSPSSPLSPFQSQLNVATLNPNPTINTAAGVSSTPIVINLNVSGQRLAQVMAPFNTGTSAFT